MIKLQLAFFNCLIITVWLFFASFTITPSVEAFDQNQDICFLWAFGAVVGPENNRELINIEKRSTLKTGDQFKMMVQPKRDCYIYIVYHGSNGEIQMLFPSDYGQFSKIDKINNRYYIPQGDLWFALDENTGQETFYLLASKIKFTKLESLINRYGTSDLSDKPKIADQIIKEIKNIKREHKHFTAKAERPVQIGGTVRGVGGQHHSMHDVSKLAVEITANDFYSETFRIEHK